MFKRAQNRGRRFWKTDISIALEIESVIIITVASTLRSTYWILQHVTFLVLCIIIIISYSGITDKGPLYKQDIL